MFDGAFIPRTRPDLGGSYSHESMTVSLLDELLRDNEINLGDFGLDATDLIFVKEARFLFMSFFKIGIRWTELT